MIRRIDLVRFMLNSLLRSEVPATCRHQCTDYFKRMGSSRLLSALTVMTRPELSSSPYLAGMAGFFLDLDAAGGN
jgi:hypothetical protein